jgi:hypothetical protein
MANTLSIARQSYRPNDMSVDERSSRVILEATTAETQRERLPSLPLIAEYRRLPHHVFFHGSARSYSGDMTEA